MQKKNMIDLCYFSPTGGTRKAGEYFCNSLAEEVRTIDLSEKVFQQPICDLVVVAVPVFGGRIPEIVTEALRRLQGKGKRAVTLAVYGNRAYEDALLELNHTIRECGFEIVASAALLAQHSIVPAVGAGRPDAQDVAEISAFAERVLVKLDKAEERCVEVPGNYPYKESKGASASPISTESCKQCGACVKCCPTDALQLKNGQVETDSERCILCMACVAKCPFMARKLPEAVQAAMNEKLSACISVRRENEFFL